MKSISRRIAGFSLIELMLVVALIGVLLVVAMPSYRQQQLAVSRSVGRSALLGLRAQQEQFYLNHRQYALSLKQLGFTEGVYAVNAAGDAVSLQSPDRLYALRVASAIPESAPREFQLQAIPVMAQARDQLCGILGLDSRGVKSASRGDVAKCW